MVRDLEAREHLFDDAFEIVELDGARGVKRALIRHAPTAPKASAGRSSTFSVVPLKTVPSSKRRTSLTSRWRLPAIMASMPGTSEGRSTPASSLSGLPSGTTEPGLRRGERGFGGRAEGAGDGFVESGSKQRAANGGFGFGPGQRLYAFAECGKRVGEAVVAVDAGDFFDEIYFAFEIETPTGECDLPRVPACRGLWQ